MKRHGIALRPILITLVLLAIGSASVWGGWKFFFGGKAGKTNVIYSHVTRGTFRHEIVGKGNAESAKNVDITCQVESAQGTTVIWIIPEGETVKKGDELVLLDSTELEDKASTQQITCNSNTATVASSQASLRTAELSLEEYIEGTFEQNWMTIENDLYTAREDQKYKADTVLYTKKLVQFGYTTPAQLESAMVAVQKEVNTLKSNLLKQTVLLKYTSEKEITKLMADIETARAKLSSDTYTAELAKNRLDYYLQMLANCSISAPQDGQVVYANQDAWRWSESDMIKEGSTVRAQQVLIRLPDPTQMQIKAMINESNIAHVKVGMKARIVFDALSSQAFEGTVIKVNQYPEIVWMSSSKDYVTIIKIDNPTELIRSGLTAQVQIESKKIPNVLMLPVQCIAEVAGKNYVLTCHDGVWGYREVKLGLSNDKQVIIEEGLSEGDQVVSGARRYKSKVTFPNASTDSDKTEEGAEEGTSEGTSEGTEEGVPNADSDGQVPVSAESSGEAPSADAPDGGISTGSPDDRSKSDRNVGSAPPGRPDGAGRRSERGPRSGNRSRPNRSPAPGENPPGGGPNPSGQPPESGTPNHAEGGPEFPDGLPEEEKSEEKQAEEINALVRGVASLIKNAEKATYVRLSSLKDQFNWTAMEICQKVDANLDKSITKEEIEATVPACLPFFDSWDRGNKGKLTRTDLVIGFCTARINYQKMSVLFALDEDATDDKFLMKKEPSVILTLLDLNGDNALTESDLPDHDVETFHSILKRFDTNGDGKVNAEELTTGVTDFKQRLTQLKQTASAAENSGGPPSPPR